MHTLSPLSFIDPHPIHIPFGSRQSHALLQLCAQRATTLPFTSSHPRLELPFLSGRSRFLTPSILVSSRLRPYSLLRSPKTRGPAPPRSFSPSYVALLPALHVGRLHKLHVAYRVGPVMIQNLADGRHEIELSPFQCDQHPNKSLAEPHMKATFQSSPAAADISDCFSVRSKSS